MNDTVQCTASFMQYRTPHGVGASRTHRDTESCSGRFAAGFQSALAVLAWSYGYGTSSYILA
jgi:hypothetical protein